MNRYSCSLPAKEKPHIKKCICPVSKGKTIHITPVNIQIYAPLSPSLQKLLWEGREKDRQTDGPWEKERYTGDLRSVSEILKSAQPQPKFYIHTKCFPSFSPFDQKVVFNFLVTSVVVIKKTIFSFLQDTTCKIMISPTEDNNSNP